MTIHLPFIDTDNHFAAIMALYDAKSADYNGIVAIERGNGDKTRNFLKSAHRELYRELIFSLKAKMTSARYIMRDAPELLKMEAFSPLVLNTNRKRMSEFTKKSEATIYRLTERLIDAKIILEKVNHGTQRDYELFLNPEMVPVSDHKNEDFNPLLYILKNSIDTTIQQTLRSICTPCSSNLNNLNKKIITGNFQEHEEVSAPPIDFNEQTGTLYGNTGDPRGSLEELLAQNMAKINTSVSKGVTTNAFGVQILPKEREKINTLDEYGQKIEALRRKEEERTRRYAIMLVEFVISVLFNSRSIYKSERNKAYKFAEYYFDKFNSETDCAKALDQYRQRVLLVERYLENNKAFSFDNIWPARYMDPENYASGFIMTQKWMKKHQDYLELQYKTRKIRTEQQMLAYALKRFEQGYRNEKSFFYWRSYLLNKAPGKIQEYEYVAVALLQQKSRKSHKTSIN